MGSLKAAALQYARLGLNTFPVAPGQKCPIKGSSGYKDATNDLEQIRAWWDDEPNYNIGVPGGMHPCGLNLFILDTDVKDGRPGRENLAKLIEENGLLPQTASWTTPTGGDQRLFSAPECVHIPKSEGTLAEGLDIRGYNGYGILPPSRTTVGHYRAASRIHPENISRAPAWLIDLVREDNTNGASSGESEPVGEVIPHGTQHNTLVSLAGTMRHRGMSADEIEAALWAVNTRRCEKPGPKKNIRKIAESVASNYEPGAESMSTFVANVLRNEVSEEEAQAYQAAAIKNGLNEKLQRALQVGKEEIADIEAMSPAALRRYLRLKIDPSHHHTSLGGVTGVTDDDELQATPLFDFSKPDPLGWIVAALIPQGHVSVLAADGGTGKSFLAIFLSLCIALGRSFFGLGTRRGRVLYVDYELDAEEQQRRVWRVAEGMGLSVADERLKERLFYYCPSAPLGTEEAHDQVMHLIEKHSIDFIVLDSLTVASAGADVTASEDVVPMMQSLREWGTVLAIDHISSNAARGNQSRATPFGSVFKRNIARSTFTLAKADGGGYMLTPDKSNFTAKQDMLCYAVEFDGESGPVTFEKINSTDGRMAGALSNMSSYDVTLTAIKELTDDDRPVTPEEVVQWRDEHDVEPIKKGTVKNHFTVLRKQGKIDVADGGALLVTSGYHTPKTYHGDAETDTPHRDEKNPPHGAQTAKKRPSQGSSHHHTSYSDRDTVMSNGNAGHSVSTNGGAERGDGAQTEAPSFDRHERVETPKGSGTVVKQEEKKVYVELDTAGIGETEAFDEDEIF